MEIITESQDATKNLGRDIAQFLKKGDIVLLEGELGAGKTVFAKGLMEGLGIGEEIVSPTFTIINPYFSEPMVYHIDVYRLHSADDFFTVGLEEIINDEGSIKIIEWGEKVKEFLHSPYWEIKIFFGDTLTTRKIIIVSPTDFKLEQEE